MKGRESRADKKIKSDLMLTLCMHTLVFSQLFLHSFVAADGGDEMGGDSCSKDSIILFQGPSSPLPTGIPTYTVEIKNACIAGCTISGIHVSCGWFSSARLVDPYIFRRLSYDDCLVNDGQPLRAGESLFFQYANTYAYPLSVSSLACH